MILLFYSKCDQASDQWQQPELASELEFDLHYEWGRVGSEDWGSKWLVDFNAKENQLVLHDRSTNNTVAIDVKIHF